MKIVIPLYIESQDVLITLEEFRSMDFESFLAKRLILSGDVQRFFLGLSFNKEALEIENHKIRMLENSENGFVDNILFNESINNYNLSLYEDIYLIPNKYFFEDTMITAMFNVIGYHSQRSTIVLKEDVSFFNNGVFSYLQFENKSDKRILALYINDKSHVSFINCRFTNCKIYVLNESTVEFEKCSFIGHETSIVQKDSGCIARMDNPVFTVVDYKFEIENLTSTNLPWLDIYKYENIVEIMENYRVKNYYLEHDIILEKENLNIKQNLSFINPHNDNVYIKFKSLNIKNNLSLSDNIVLDANIQVENTENTALFLSNFQGKILINNSEHIQILQTNFIPLNKKDASIKAINSSVILNNCVLDYEVDSFIYSINSQLVLKNGCFIDKASLLIQLDKPTQNNVDNLFDIKEVSVAILDSTINVAYVFDELLVKNFIAIKSKFYGGSKDEEYLMFQKANVQIEQCEFQDIQSYTVCLFDNGTLAEIKQNNFKDNNTCIVGGDISNLVLMENSFENSAKSAVLLKNSLLKGIKNIFKHNKIGVELSNIDEVGFMDTKMEKQVSTYYDIHSKYINNYKKAVDIQYGTIYEILDYSDVDMEDEINIDG